MTEEDLATLALSLPEAAESAHFGKRNFRVREKIFMSLPRPGEAVLKFGRDQQLLAVASAPDLLAPVKGGWGLKGWTVLSYATASPDIARELLTAAWRNVAPARLLKQQGP